MQSHSGAPHRRNFNLMSNLQLKFSRLLPPQLLRQEADQEIIETASDGDDQAGGTNSSGRLSDHSATLQWRG